MTREEELESFAYTLATGRLYCELGPFVSWCETLLQRQIHHWELGHLATWNDLRRAYERQLAARVNRDRQSVSADGAAPPSASRLPARTPSCECTSGRRCLACLGLT